MQINIEISETLLFFDPLFNNLLFIFKRRIKFIPRKDFEEFIPKAINLFPNHTKDVQYLVLALKFDCVLWSEEKLLKNQNLVKVFNTEELFEFLKNVL